MKKTLLAFTCLLSFSTYLHAFDSSAPAQLSYRLASNDPVIKIDVQLLKHGKLEASTTISTQNAQSAPFSSERFTTYRKTIERKNGVVTVIPDTVTSGIRMRLTPVVIDNNKMLIETDFAMSELLSFKEISIPGGHKTDSIQLPQTASASFMSRVIVEDGKEMSLPFDCHSKVDKEASSKPACVLKISASRKNLNLK